MVQSRDFFRKTLKWLVPSNYVLKKNQNERNYLIAELFSPLICSAQSDEEKVTFEGFQVGIVTNLYC